MQPRPEPQFKNIGLVYVKIPKLYKYKTLQPIRKAINSFIINAET